MTMACPHRSAENADPFDKQMTKLISQGNGR